MRDRASRVLLVIGPGLLVAATGVGAGDLATAAFTGVHLGTAVLWAVILGAFLKFVLNEGLARWQLATGETVLEGAVRRLGPAVPIFFLPYLLIWSWFVGAALMGACGVTAHAAVPIFDDPVRGKVVFGIVHALLGLGLVWWGRFRAFERLMAIFVGLMVLCVLGTALFVRPPVGELLRGLFVPSIPEASSGGLGWTVALIGGVGGTLTVICYGYWIREVGRRSIDDLRVSRIDLATGYLATALFGLAMVVIGSTVEVDGRGALLVVQLADRLAETLGPVASWVFLLGAWCAVFSSLLGVWQSVPHVFADFWRLLRDRETVGVAVDERSRPYRAFLVALTFVPMVGLFVKFELMAKLYAVLGASFMPLLALVLLLLNGRFIAPEHRNRPQTVAVLCGILAFFVYAGWRAVIR